MSTENKVKGSASYFPSIEKTYGKPIAHSMKVIDSLEGTKHMEIVEVLKTKHALGHGHANVLVAYRRAQSSA